MPLKRIEECTLDDLFGLFEIEELTPEELKQAKKKVWMLHPDKNISKDTTKYYEYFKEAYHKLETVFEFINRHQKQVVSKTYQTEELGQQGFYEYCQKKGLKERELNTLFNEVFENVYISDKGDGYGEWLKTEEGLYDKTDLEGSRKKAMALVVMDKEIKTLQEVDDKDIKNAYVQSILPIDAQKVFQETPQFKSVHEYQRHRANEKAEPISKKQAERILVEKEHAEYKTSLHLSYELLKKTESQAHKMKDYYSKFLRIEE